MSKTYRNGVCDGCKKRKKITRTTKSYDALGDFLWCEECWGMLDEQ